PRRRTGPLDLASGKTEPVEPGQAASANIRQKAAITPPSAAPKGSCGMYRAHHYTGTKTWLARHPRPSSEAFIFCDRDGGPLKSRHLVQILHRLSAKAGLPSNGR